MFAAVKETAPELQPEPVPQPKKTEQPEKQPVVDFFGKVQSEDAPQAPLAPGDGNEDLALALRKLIAFRLCRRTPLLESLPKFVMHPSR